MRTSTHHLSIKTKPTQKKIVLHNRSSPLTKGKKKRKKNASC